MFVCFDNSEPRQLRCECGAFLSVRMSEDTGSILRSGTYYCKNPRCERVTE